MFQNQCVKYFSFKGPYPAFIWHTMFFMPSDMSAISVKYKFISAAGGAVNPPVGATPPEKLPILPYLAS